MPLDPQVRALLDRFAGRPTVDMLPVEVGRRAFSQSTAKLIPRPDVAVSSEDRAIDGPAGPLRVRVYRPLDAPAVPAPMIVYFHGGGWVVCDLDTHDALCRRLCSDAGAIVVSAEYRLAPEHRFPAAPDDCAAATRWAFSHAASLGADPARIVLAGDSAGGNLATAVALRLRDAGGAHPAGLLLLYPVTDHWTAGHWSYEEFAEGHGLTRTGMAWFWAHYVGDSLDARRAGELSGQVAPLRAEDLSGLPPTLVITAECDVLRDEGEAFAMRLVEAGVAASVLRCEGMHHGFMSYVGVLDGTERAMVHAAAWLRAR